MSAWFLSKSQNLEIYYMLNYIHEQVLAKGPPEIKISKVLIGTMGDVLGNLV